MLRNESSWDWHIPCDLRGKGGERYVDTDLGNPAFDVGFWVCWTSVLSGLHYSLSPLSLLGQQVSHAPGHRADFGYSLGNWLYRVLSDALEKSWSGYFL